MSKIGSFAAKVRGLAFGQPGADATFVDASHPLPIEQVSLKIGSSADGLSVSISGTSAQSAALTPETAVIYATVDCFAIYGSSPTATTSCRFIPANTLVRVRGWASGQKLAFITGGATGTVYISPGA